MPGPAGALWGVRQRPWLPPFLPTPSPSCDNTKFLQKFPNVPRGAKPLFFFFKAYVGDLVLGKKMSSAERLWPHGLPRVTGNDHCVCGRGRQETLPGPQKLRGSLPPSRLGSL